MPLFGLVDLKNAKWDVSYNVHVLSVLSCSTHVRTTSGLQPGTTIRVDALLAEAAEAIPTLDTKMIQHAGICNNNGNITRISRVAQPSSRPS